MLHVQDSGALSFSTSAAETSSLSSWACNWRLDLTMGLALAVQIVSNMFKSLSQFHRWTFWTNTILTGTKKRSLPTSSQCLQLVFVWKNIKGMHPKSAVGDEEGQRDHCEHVQPTSAFGEHWSTKSAREVVQSPATMCGVQLSWKSTTWICIVCQRVWYNSI